MPLNPNMRYRDRLGRIHGPFVPLWQQLLHDPEHRRQHSPQSDRQMREDIQEDLVSTPEQLARRWTEGQVSWTITSAHTYWGGRRLPDLSTYNLDLDNPIPVNHLSLESDPFQYVPNLSTQYGLPLSTQPSSNTESTMPAPIQVRFVPPPSNVPANARCDEIGCINPIRVRFINCLEDDKVFYVCKEHGYRTMAAPFEYREDLDAVLLYPFYKGDKPVTKAEYEAGTAVCPNCGDRVDAAALTMPAPQGALVYSGPPICPSCQSNWFTTCHGCGVAMLRNQDNPDDRHCPACARYRIFGSKRRPTPVFFKASEADDARFTGAEIELELDGAFSREEVTRKLLEPLPVGLIHAEEDGSLNYGVEYVTMPLSASYINQNIDLFRKFYDTAQEYANPANTRNNAGLHVHMSRAAIQPNEAVKMEELVTKPGLMQRWLLHLTRRSPDRFAHWANASPDPVVLDTLARGARPNVSRYRFLNWQPKATVECRGFAGDTDFEHFLTATQFVRALHDFTKSSEFDLKCTAFRRFIQNSQYEVLAKMDAKFVDSRGSNTIKAQLAPGHFNHKGHGYYLKAEPSVYDEAGLCGLNRSKYASVFDNRMHISHAKQTIHDPVTNATYMYSSGTPVEVIQTNIEVGKALSITTNRERVLEEARDYANSQRIKFGSTCFYVGAYVFNQLEQLHTMGLMSNEPSMAE